MTMICNTYEKRAINFVVGEKEKADGTVCVRYRFSSKKPQETMKLEDFIKYVEDKVATHFIGI